MKPMHLFTLLASIVCASAHADGDLQMTGLNSAVVQYDDHCSNGKNIVEATRNEFIQNMLKNPKSRLAMAASWFSTSSGGQEVTKGTLTKWLQSFHLRSGCATNQNSFSAILQSTDVMSNSHVTVAKYLVTVDDDDEAGTRTLRLRSIQRLSIRSER